MILMKHGWLPHRIGGHAFQRMTFAGTTRPPKPLIKTETKGVRQRVRKSEKEKLRRIAARGQSQSIRATIEDGRDIQLGVLESMTAVLGRSKLVAPHFSVRKTRPFRAAVSDMVPLTSLDVPRRLVNDWLKRNIALASGLSLMIRYMSGDVIAQTIFEGSTNLDDYDVMRTAGFAGFGLFYGGTVGTFFYTVLWQRLFGHLPAMKKAVCMTTADTLIHVPFVYFPVFYVVTELVYHKQITINAVRRALQKFRAALPEDMVSCCMVWVPMHIFNFALLPIQLRMPFMSTVGIIWGTVLSVKNGRKFKD